MSLVDLFTYLGFLRYVKMREVELIMQLSSNLGTCYGKRANDSTPIHRYGAYLKLAAFNKLERSLLPPIQIYSSTGGTLTFQILDLTKDTAPSLKSTHIRVHRSFNP